MNRTFEHLGELLEIDVVGAPMRVGQRVTIARASDDSADQRFLGKRGVVRGLLYDAAELYPHEPFVSVHVDGLGSDLFFPHELKVQRAPPKK